jgi:hypothetical protein
MPGTSLIIRQCNAGGDRLLPILRKNLLSDYTQERQHRGSLSMKFNLELILSWIATKLAPE